MGYNKFHIVSKMKGVLRLSIDRNEKVIISVTWWSWFVPGRIQKICKMATFLSTEKSKWCLRPVWPD